MNIMMVDEGPFASVFLHQHMQRQQQQFSPLRTPEADLGNFTIEHVDNAGNEENLETLLLIEEKSQQPPVAEDDILEIGIEANDLNSLLEQFEETEATLKSATECVIPAPVPPPPSNGNVTSAQSSATANSPFKNVRKPPSKKDVDPTEVAKKIVPAKRKSAILLEPQSMPAKRMRGKTANQMGSERGCTSLPGSRSGSPVPNHLAKQEGKLPGFNYLNLEHDYCTDKSNNNITNFEKKKEIELLAQQKFEQMENAKNARANKAKDPVAAKAAANERKQMYKKRQYKLKKKKGSNAPTPEGSEQGGDSNLPTPASSPNRESSSTPNGTTPNTSPTRSSTFITPNASPSVSKAQSNYTALKEKTLHYFDKIPDYFPTKLFSMYQEIGSADQTEKDIKEEKEPTLASDTNSYSRAGEAGSDTSFSHTVNTDASFSHTVNTAFTSPTTNPCDSSCALSEPPEIEDQEVEEGRAFSPCSRGSVCSRPGSPCSRTGSPARSRKRSWRNSESRHSQSRSPSFCSTCSSRSRSRSHSRTPSQDSSRRAPSQDGSTRQRNSSYSSYYSSRSWSSPSRSRSRSRSYSRSRSRSSSYTRNSKSPSKSRSRSPSKPKSRSRYRSRSHYSRSSAHSPSPKRRKSRRLSRRKRRKRTHSHRSNRSGYSSSRRSGYSSNRMTSASRSRSRRRSSRRSSRKRQRRDSNRQSERRERRRNGSREQEREWKKQRWDEQMEKQKQQWEDRRVIYVGRIEDSCTKEYLARRFGRFGEIDKVTAHFRDEGDNYAFVTYRYTCDAFAAMEGVNHDKDEPEYDICFGGRRQFCQSNYADLDSMNHEEVAMEFGYQDPGVVQERVDEPVSTETDFDLLLKQAMKNAKKR